MIARGYRLALARMLKLYTEVTTEDGTVLVSESEDNEIKVGDEVYVSGEDGLKPAPDQEYVDTVNNRIIVVAGGTVTEIREKESTMETGSDNGEEGNQEGSQEENMENNEGSDNGSDNGNSENDTNSTSEMETENETLKTENEALKAKVAELEATVSDLEDQIAAYKAKEEETSAPAAEDAEKFAKQTTGDAKLDKKLAAARRILNAVK